MHVCIDKYVRQGLNHNIARSLVPASVSDLSPHDINDFCATPRDVSYHDLNFIATQRRLVMRCRPSEAVLSDSNLAWAITQTLILKRSQDLHSYDFKEWEVLRNVNAAFREAVEGQPLTVHLPRQLDEEGKVCLQQTKLPIAELYCVPGDERVIDALLSGEFRYVICVAHGNLRLQLGFLPS